VRAVDVGGVEEGDPGGDGVVDELDHVRLGLGRPVDAGAYSMIFALLY